MGGQLLWKTINYLTISCWCEPRKPWGRHMAQKWPWVTWPLKKVTVTFLSGQVRPTEKLLRHRAALMAYAVAQVCFV